MSLLAKLGPDQSHWGEGIRALIHEFLPTLEPFTSRIEALWMLRQAIWKEYSWDDRKGDHGYERYNALTKIIASQLRTALAPDPMPHVPIWMARRAPWLLAVHCAWCNSRPIKLRSGCIDCFARHERMTFLRSHDDFVAGLKLCRDKPTEPGPRLVLADWLEERGYCDLSELVKKVPA